MESSETLAAAREVLTVAVPSVGEGGLDARRSHHFGRSPNFTLVGLSGGETTNTRVIGNGSHAEGGCRASAQLLVSAGANALVAAGIGARPLAILSEAGVDVYFERELKTVGEAVAALAAGELRRIEPDQTCSHHSGSGHGDHSC